MLHNGVRCHRFVADFDARATIESVLEIGPDTVRIEPQASLSKDDEIIASTAYVHSLSQKFRGHVGPGSATHNTNHWHFAKQTAVRVTVGHQEIMNARAKDKARLVKEATKLAK